jgi:predicted DNA-binding transcriptional regulator AlpA
MRRTIAIAEIGPLCGKARKTGWGWVNLPGFPKPVGTETRGNYPHSIVYDRDEVEQWLKASGKWSMPARRVNQPKRTDKPKHKAQENIIRQFLASPPPGRQRITPTGTAKTVRVRINGDNGPL